MPDASGDRLLATAFAIAQQIVAGAVWHGDRCNWIGALPEEGPGGGMRQSYRALGADLYGGSAGVGLFLAEVALATADESCRRAALGALRHAVSRSDSLAAPQVGLYGGPAGVALALALAARALDAPELDAAARDIAARLQAPGPADELDLMSGSAGAVVGLLALRALLADDRLLDLAARHGDALLAGAESAGDGALCWPARLFPGTPRLTGLSHGAAGVALALLELAAATGEQRYRSAATAGFAYERALLDPVARNWPDLRGGGSAFAVFWCHGAAGGALARVRALELGGEQALRAEAQGALEVTAAWVRETLASGASDFSLCHGLAGNAEVLREGRALSPDAEGLAGRAARAGIDDHAGGPAWPCGAQGGSTPCLFLGLAGIGRFYLRLARSEMPSVLVVRAGEAAAAYRPAQEASVAR